MRTKCRACSRPSKANTRGCARVSRARAAVHVGVGDVVKAGQTLAIIESNVSLTAYTVTAPFAGTILDVAAVPGDLAGDEPLFELADLSSLWVDLHLFGGDAQHITPGLSVEITRLSDGAQATTKLDRILPGTATASQSTVARATIKNADGQWRPGAAVRARVTVQRTSGRARRARHRRCRPSKARPWCSRAREIRTPRAR